ncbi:breast carcinoma amplified sequence 2 [Trichoderma sp. SZMC 28014]
MAVPAYHESLPYIDSEPTPQALSAAHALISAEQQTFSPPPESSAKEREPSFSPAITAEFTRLASKQPSQILDFSRYEAQEIPAPQSSKDIDALRTPLSNAFISSSYLSSRAQNLKLLDAHGRNAWLLSNYHLEDQLRSIERDLADTKRDIDLVNAARAARQNDVKAEMQGLEQNWRAGVGRVLETEIAVQELKEQIRQELRNNANAAEYPSQ